MSLEDRDRLSFGEGPLGGPLPEPEPEEEVERRPNRAFVFLAIAMGGLILLGVLALVAALTLWVPAQRRQRIAQVTQTVAAMTMEAAAWTPTFTPSPTPVPPTLTATAPPTWTPIPTPTATRVVSEEQLTPQPTATKAPSAGWETTTPPAGLGVFGTAAIAVGLAGLMFAVRRLRTLR